MIQCCAQDWTGDHLITMLQFAPGHAVIGGLAIGTLSAGKTLLTGRILGISGAVKHVSVPSAARGILRAHVDFIVTW
jgi:hypothetical protein